MVAYLDLPSGLSGDMLLGCLIDGGWPADRLRETIAALHLPEDQWAVRVEQVVKGPLRATRVDVLVDETPHPRGLEEIRRIINAAALGAAIRERAIAVFNRLAAAEAKVHGVGIEQIHFHEVGALDAMIDIVGNAAGLEALGIQRLHASPLPLGPGWTVSEHGRLPLPAPATLELLAAVGAPTRPAPGPGELVTPTAAALLAEFATFTQPAMTLSRIAVGAGQKDFPWPNVARLWLGEGESPAALVQLETNLDDMNPQLYSAVLERLLALGALDAWLTPVQMKKGRPGVVLGVLARSGDESLLVNTLLAETTTLGVRVVNIDRRHEAGRAFHSVQTPFGAVRAKVKFIEGKAAGAMPEFDDCAALARQAGVPPRRVQESAAAACQALLETLWAAEAGAEPRRI